MNQLSIRQFRLHFRAESCPPCDLMGLLSTVSSLATSYFPDFKLLAESLIPAWAMNLLLRCSSSTRLPQVRGCFIIVTDLSQVMFFQAFPTQGGGGHESGGIHDFKCCA